MKFLKFFSIVSMTVVGGLCAGSCDCHHFDDPDPGMAVGDLLCTDGEVLSFEQYVKTGKEAVAIVYYVNPDIDDEIRGYAVYLGDVSDEAFADTISVNQGTSTNLYELNGNENTYSLYKCEDATSPMAYPVFDLWTYGQSAYIPSVAQLRQIQEVKNAINPKIEAIGGDILPDMPDDCWYWSSTEVEGQEDLKAWLVSMHSGIIQETPKDQKHHCRPVVTIYRHNNHTPGSGDYDDVLNGFKTDLKVNLSLNREMLDYALVDSLQFATRSDAQWDIRYCVAAYRRDNPEPYDIQTSYDGYVTFSLPPGKYNFVGWADPVPTYDDKSFYFYTDDFSEILLRHKYDYEGQDYGKTAYRSKKELRVAYNTKEMDMVLEPAVARYRLVSTDKPTFTPGKVLISYYDLPASIHGLSGLVNNYWSDVSFISKIDGNEICFDHVLAHDDKEITVNACVEIYDDRDNLRARVRNVGIPLINGGITTLKGNFFSTLQLDNGQTQGGIIIDPAFEETVEIEY